MNDELNVSLPQGEPPSDALLQSISQRLKASSTKAVHPLPSNGVLWAIALAIFALASFALAAVVKFKAISALSGGEMTVYYGTIALFAILFARSVIERMIPGERRLIPVAFLCASVLIILAVLMCILFSDYTTERFVARGVPCLRTGVISAILSGLLGWRLLRRGYWVSPRETVLLYSFFSGLVGVSVLALHCPIRNSLHCSVWHLGAMVLSGTVGALLGRHFENAD